MLMSSACASRKKTARKRFSSLWIRSAPSKLHIFARHVAASAMCLRKPPNPKGSVERKKIRAIPSIFRVCTSTYPVSCLDVSQQCRRTHFLAYFLHFSAYRFQGLYLDVPTSPPVYFRVCTCTHFEDYSLCRVRTSTHFEDNPLQGLYLYQF